MDQPPDDRLDDDDVDYSELVEVALFSNRFEADLARTALDAAGIEYAIGGEQIGAYGPVTAFSQGVRLLVRSKDAEMARAALSPTAAENGAPEDD